MGVCVVRVTVEILEKILVEGCCAMRFSGMPNKVLIRQIGPWSSHQFEDFVEIIIESDEFDDGTLAFPKRLALVAERIVP